MIATELALFSAAKETARQRRAYNHYHCGLGVSRFMSSQKTELERAFIDHQHTLQLFLYKSVDSRDDAQDLLQECYVRLVKSPTPPESAEGTRAYLFTIARNLVTDLFRRRSVNGYGRNVDVSSLELQDPALCPERSLELSQELQCLKRCIQNMPEATRTIFLLSRFEDMTYPQIANSLGVSTRTVERKMREAMTLLSNSLEGTAHE
ncbi:MAG: RNA polymerase sigma factor [Anaerolineaceae bacterium]|nr:RNA polymerase sigma factor [Anaerolineaceae bacterium]